MRILHIINSSNPSGGGPIEAILQAQYTLGKEGHIMEMVCLDPPEAAWIKGLPLKTYALGPARTKYRYAAGFVPWLRAHGSDYDCAIVHGIWLHPSLGAWRVLRSLGVPYFVYTHGLLDPAHKTVFPLKHRVKSVAWKLFEHRVIRDASAVFFTCEEERRLATMTFKPFDCNAMIVPYCVGEPPGDAESQEEAFLQQFPECRDKRLLVFLSRIHRKKGCDLLVEAFSRVAGREDVRLVMVGPDSMGWQRELEEKAEQLGVGERITWTGMLSGDLKWGAFRAADAFVLPSHQENFGIAVVEALACGVPVLITKPINIWREIVEDGAGIAETDDLQGAESLLRGWIEKPLSDADAMRENARRCFETRFRSEEAGRTLLAALRAGGVKESDAEGAPT